MNSPNAGLFGDYEDEDVFDPCEVEPWQDGRVWISEAVLCDETPTGKSTDRNVCVTLPTTQGVCDEEVQSV